MGEARRRKLAGESIFKTDKPIAKKHKRKKRLREYAEIPNTLKALAIVTRLMSRRKK